jgi:hypothetical protein
MDSDRHLKLDAGNGKSKSVTAGCRSEGGLLKQVALYTYTTTVMTTSKILVNINITTKTFGFQFPKTVKVCLIHRCSSEFERGDCEEC